MARWAYMLGGLIVWLVHFFGVYALASLGDVVATADAPAWRAAVAAFSAACLALALALAALALRARRRAGTGPRFAHDLAAGAAGLGALGIVWQTLPSWIGH